MVDFEERDAAEFCEAIGSAVEAGSEQEGLACAGGDGLAHEVVYEAGADYGGAAGARPSEVEDAGGEAAEGGQGFEAAG